MSRTWNNQFTARIGRQAADLLALGFEDTSWGNDACPSFTKGEILIWVEDEDPARRENPMEAYVVVVDRKAIWQGSDWEACKAFLEYAIQFDTVIVV